MYDPILVQPMREELTNLGVKELRTAADVDTAMAQDGTTLVVVNSVCGCAAGAARPGIALSRRHGVQPDHTVTVFAGQDKEATEQARKYFTNQPPSSPAIGLMRNGELVHFIPRHFIEGRSPEMIAQALEFAFDEFCADKTASSAE